MPRRSLPDPATVQTVCPIPRPALEERSSPPGKGGLGFILPGASPPAPASASEGARSAGRFAAAGGGLPRRSLPDPATVQTVCPIPRPALEERSSPPGKGGLGFILPGASPPAPASASEGARSAGRFAAAGGGLPRRSLPDPATVQTVCPHPPPTRARRALFPRWGRGRFLVFLCKGLRPLQPRARAGKYAGRICGFRYLSERRGACLPLRQK